MSLTGLQKFLQENAIPKVKKKPKTFLGISNQPHYEDVLTNWYAFYFDVTEEHGLSDLFIKSLMELLEYRYETKEIFANKTLNFGQGFTPETQFSTDENGRIDLLLQSDDSAIIIESKVYHTLSNNLTDYWDSIKLSDQNKLGIVLSLQPIRTINHSDFVNITHSQLLAQVYKNIGDHLVSGNSKYLIFLNDFHQNISNLSQPYMEEKDFEFYYEHQSKINQLIEYQATVRKHLENEVRKACDLLAQDGLNLKLYESKGDLGNRLTYYVSEVDKNLMFTIVYGDLLTEETELKLIVELKGKALVNKGIYRKICITDNERGIFKEDFYSSTNKVYAHFAFKPYVLEISDIRNLSEVIYDKLNEDGFVSIFKRLENFLGQPVLSK
ncbi:PD-(D/E)XK nuclease family protein [Mangrovimonas aestuarii]|uniref:PD-(D/E)XK nuclease family protein n=1 Tax=Mangrovimonas aestuarii TaxID=3018443 RepID=UPI002379FACE|nr:PD-(D/E)XK nuclease family protein [Mangrovimonas aestuarii]